MNLPANLYGLIETIVGLLIFVVAYLAILISIIVCLVIADLVYEGVRAYKKKSDSLDHVSSEIKVNRSRSPRVRHIFQH